MHGADSRTALEGFQPRSLLQLSDYLQGLIKGRLWVKVIVAMAFGVLVGTLLGPSVGWIAPRTAKVIGDWLAFPGQLFLALIQMIVIPLVFASVVRGLTAVEDFERLKRMGLQVGLFFVTSTALAIVIGLWLAIVIKPGDFVSGEMVRATLGSAPSVEAVAPPERPRLSELPQKIVTLLPTNPFGSIVQSNMLQIVLFALIIGLALAAMTAKQSKPMLDVLGSLQEVCMTIVRFTMRLAPIAVFGLMAQLSSKIGISSLLGMLVYVGSVLLGLGIMFVLYLIVVFTFLRRSPRRFLSAVREVLLLAFSTSSSAAVMPLSIKTAEEKLGVRPSVAQLVIPLGATVNMNGTALYQGVATLFLAQVFGVDIDVSGLALIVLVAVGASIGSPATPGVGIVILATLLTTAGIPPSGIALIMGVDRLLDMSRTAINVCGDLVASLLIDRLTGPEPSS